MVESFINIVVTILSQIFVAMVLGFCWNNGVTELGATTGRRRQVNWINWNLVERGVHMNNVTTLIVNKADVLDQVGAWGIVHNGETIEFKNKAEYKHWLEKHSLILDINLVFSEGADDMTFVEHL